MKAANIEAFKGRLDVLQLLMEKGARINSSRGHGINALSVAAGEGHLHVVKWLVENKALEAEYGTPSALTAVMFAITNEHYETAKYLEAKLGKPQF